MTSLFTDSANGSFWAFFGTFLGDKKKGVGGFVSLYGGCVHILPTHICDPGAQKQS